MERLDYNALADLAKKVQNGDEEAFNRLYEATYKAQYFIALTNTSNPSLADEVVQEVYLSVFKSIKNLRDPKTIISFMNKINYNCCLDILKKEKSSSKVNYDDVSPFIINTNIPTETQVLETISAKNEVNLALSQMDPSLSSVLVLRYMQDMKIEEIAQQEHISSRTVKRYIKKGGLEMKKILEKIRNSNFVFTFFTSPFLISTFNQQKQQIDANHAVDTFAKVAAGAGLATGAVSAGGILTTTSVASGPIIAACLAGTLGVGGIGVVASIPRVNIDYNPTAYTNTVAQIEVTKSGLTNIKYLEAYDENNVLVSNADATGVLQFGSNGTYTIKVYGDNSLTSTETVTISNIDHSAPVLSNYAATDENVSFMADDSQCGVDYNTLTITDEHGQQVDYYIEGNTVYYSTAYPVVNVSVKDNLNNEAHTKLELKYIVEQQ